jgi:hypothetical protein
MIGVPIYAVAHGVEFIAPKSASLQFFTTSYNMTGNTALDSGFLFALICVAGHIVNVTMGDGVFRGLFLKVVERRCSFFKAEIDKKDDTDVSIQTGQGVAVRYVAQEAV